MKHLKIKASKKAAFPFFLRGYYKILLVSGKP